VHLTSDIRWRLTEVGRHRRESRAWSEIRSCFTGNCESWVFWGFSSVGSEYCVLQRCETASVVNLCYRRFDTLKCTSKVVNGQGPQKRCCLEMSASDFAHLRSVLREPTVSLCFMNWWIRAAVCCVTSSTLILCGQRSAWVALCVAGLTYVTTLQYSQAEPVWMKMSGAHCPKYSEENVPQCLFVHKPHLEWPGNEPWLPRWVGDSPCEAWHASEHVTR